MENEKHNSETSRTKTRCTIWRRRTLLERYLILICIAIFIALLVAIGAIFHAKHIHKRRLSSTCLSPECTEEAQRIINYMDTSVDPCEDFYNFSCGSYLKTPYSRSYDDRAFNNEVYDSMELLIKELLESKHEEEHEFVKKVKRFYQSCLSSSKDAVEIIKDILKRTKLRRWPIPKDDEANMESLEKSFSISYIYGQVNPFLRMTGRLNITSGQIFFYPGATFVPEEVLLNKTDIKCIAKKKKYIEVLEYTLFKLKVPLQEDLVKKMIEFETHLANLTHKHRRNYDQSETTMILKEFSSNCTGINWTFVIRNIYDHFRHSDDFSDEIPVMHRSKEYIENLCKLLAETSERTIYIYLVWSLLVQELSEIHPFYRSNMHQIKYDYSTLDRWQYCVSEIVYGDFQPGVAYLALHRLHPEETKKEVEGYVDEVKEVMDHMFLENSWMSSVTKSAARKKLENIRAAISHFDESMDVDMIEEYFQQFNVTESYTENQLMTLERETQSDFFDDLFSFGENANVRIPQPILISAHYLKEEIVVSLGFLTPPHFRLGMPKYYNYGSVGVVIGHEFMHGFDNLDSEGNTTYEWSEESIEQFKQKKQCYVDQYSKFPLEYEGYKMDTSLTIREDIADNVAIGQVFKAYEKHLRKNGPEPKLPGLDFTNEQMFFIRYGQSWCGLPKIDGGKFADPSHNPGRYRIIGSLQNLPRFSEIFNCPENSPMNPIHKCHMY